MSSGDGGQGGVALRASVETLNEPVKYFDNRSNVS